MEIVHFTVDASIINRLGLELVAKSETAISELIKNAYDADANSVIVRFTASNQLGGSLEIEDDGEGMDKDKLLNGFLRLATTDKIHNTVSQVYKRPKAGRKGIGRFSTQRLGTKLTIITQTKDSKTALKLIFDWDNYETDKDIQKIGNELDEIPRLDKPQGTILKIDYLREKWSEANIKRVYRYVSDLIQPNFLKIENNKTIIEKNKEEAFEVVFFVRDNADVSFQSIADPQIMLLDKALATFSGYINQHGKGFSIVQSRPFYIKGEKCALNDTFEIGDYELLENTRISFKCYYYIGGSRNSYYGISKPELNVIENYLKQKGGVRLYRNGFIVAKYGTRGNDWLDIDKNGAKSRLGLPFNNDRIIGFVELRDSEGTVFNESAGREGLLETEAFNEMQNFIAIALDMCFKNFASWFKKTDEYLAENPGTKQVVTTIAFEETIADIKDAAKILSDEKATEQEKVEAGIKIDLATKKLLTETKAALNELEMMRILAGTGLIIGEFVHEIKQFVPSLKGYIHDLKRLNLDKINQDNLLSMENVLDSFLSYTAYFDTTIAQNVLRELKPIDLKDAIRYFENIVNRDILQKHITFSKDFNHQNGIISCPMHPSEWNTILQNLYSNAKKAIRKSGVQQGEILISCSKDVQKGLVFLNFYDNGIGIPKNNKKRIFDAFFTTYPPIDGHVSDETGMGLGLYILKQIIENRGGKISVGQPIEDFKTCISIQLPLVTSKQYQQYYGN